MIFHILRQTTLDVSLKIRDEQIWFQTSIQNLHVVTASFEMNRREISQADVRYNYGYDTINDMVIITHPV
jgi:hypothetical protein